VGLLRDLTDTNPFLVFACSHASSEQEAYVSAELERLRIALQFDVRHVFKYSRTQDRLKPIVLETFLRLPIEHTVVAIDKRGYLASTEDHTQPLDVFEGIGLLIEVMPAKYVGGQRLLIDMSRSEKGFVRNIRNTAKVINRQSARPNFASIVPRPDHRSDAQLVQIADVIAGYVRSNLYEDKHDFPPNISLTIR
jgi:hypothetical protein